MHVILNNRLNIGEFFFLIFTISETVKTDKNITTLGNTKNWRSRCSFYNVCLYFRGVGSYMSWKQRILAENICGFPQYLSTSGVVP
jgi:hypothetical protein